MRRTKFPFVFGVLALAAVLFSLQSTVVALQEPARPSSAQQPQTQQDPAAPPSTMRQAANTETFTGKIANAGGKFVLRDNATKMTYALDDQSQAKKFDGQNVKVTGTLDAQTNTIRVSAIEPES